MSALIFEFEEGDDEITPDGYTPTVIVKLGEWEVTRYRVSHYNRSQTKIEEAQELFASDMGQLFAGLK